MKKLSLLFMLMLLPLVSSVADPVKIGDNFYNLNSSTQEAEVTNSAGGEPVEFGSYYGSVSIPNSVRTNGVSYKVTSIGDYAFVNCTGVTDVRIRSGVTSIGKYAFYNCSRLTSVTIPSSVTSIEECAFINCTSLPSITIPDGVTSIAESAFQGCSGLTSVTMGNNVTTIEKGAFFNCSGLESITIPNSVTSIGSYAFAACSGLTAISLPYVVSMGEAAFQNCTGLQWFTIPWAVTSIEDNTFQGCTGLTYVGIHDRVTSIGSNAFSGCSSLESVTIPNSVTSIGDEAFYNCSALTSVISLITKPFAINKNVFAGKDYSFTSATLYVYMELKWEYMSISGWKEFQNIEAYRPNIDGIYYYMFLGLKEATVTNRTGDSSGGGSYSGSVSIPNTITFDGVEYTVTSIGDDAFYNCTDLTSVNMGNSVKTIGEDAFYHCSKLETITIPDGVSSIGEYAFGECTSLSSITIPDGVTSIGVGTFYNCTGLSSITIPDGVTSIGVGAFDNCTGLTSVNMGNSVKTIGEDAFGGCSKLTSITIPGSVTRIGSIAFADCTSLSVVTSLITEPFEIDEDVFDSPVYASATLNVPKGTKSKYEATATWNLFQKIVEIGEGRRGDVNGDNAVDVADIATIIDVMAGKAPEYKDKADVNKDNTVDVADIAIVIDIMAGKDTDTPEEQAYTACPDANHPHWTDLGLPSGTQWRCCNQGASSPEDYGSYYTFDEAQAYNPPSLDQIKELLGNTTSEWTTENGVKGRRFTGTNGRSLFIPAAGYLWAGTVSGDGVDGDYWSSTPDDDHEAYDLRINYVSARWDYDDRRNGQSVRPVRKN